MNFGRGEVLFLSADHALSSGGVPNGADAAESAADSPIIAIQDFFFIVDE